MSAEVHLELLMGKVVHDHHGRRVGRIEEVRAARNKDGWIVTHYFLGPVGLMQRLSIRGIGLWFLNLARSTVVRTATSALACIGSVRSKEPQGHSR